MSPKLLTKNISPAKDKYVVPMVQFYMKLPVEVIEQAIESLNRDDKKKVKKLKKKGMREMIMSALTSSKIQFAEGIYQYLKDGMLFPEYASYEEVIDSYNDENCIMNTVFILKKCCDGSYDKKTTSAFFKSEQFTKIISEDEEIQEENDINEEQLSFELPESTETELSSDESEYNYYSNISDDIYLPNTESSTAIHEMHDIPEEETIAPEETLVYIPDAQKEKPAESSPSRKKQKEEAEVYYIGHIEQRETYYNFAPQYKLEKTGSHKKLTELRQVAETFPPNGTINLSYVRTGSSQSQKVIELLDKQFTFAISFEEDDIEENINYITGEKHTDVNLKIDLQKVFDKKRNSTTFFRKISDLRIFRIAEPDEIISDNRLCSGSVQVSDDFARGEFILLRRKADNTTNSGGEISGPYRVDKREGKTFIQPKVADERYLLNCYNEKQLVFGMSERQKFGDDPICIPFAMVKDNSNYRKDVISDDVLIKCMISETSKDFINTIKKKPEEVAKLFSKSVFLSGNLPEEVKSARLARIQKLFSDIQNYTAEQRQIAEIFISSYNTDSHVKEVLAETVKSSPEYKQMQKELEKQTKIAEQAENRAKSAIETAKAMKISEKNGEIEVLEKKIADLKAQHSALLSYDDIAKAIEHQESIRSFLMEENSKLKHRNTEIKGQIKSTITEQANEVNIAFDPYVSNAMLEAASQWRTKQESEIYSIASNHIMQTAENSPHMDRQQLCEYLVDYIKQYRNYSANDIINMYVCIAQGFLTVFSGLPGTGKTSMCNIISSSLGLMNFNTDEIPEVNCNRFVPVSVEKGWTSKKDLIGYYNPLTKKYDKSNRRLYDSLMILNEEKDNSPFPYIVLLDEANLSPMEYYWADFMQLADKSEGRESYINIGLENDIYIPDTLRFVATINNDQTTETLSPRLLDRAWIIKLPDSEIKEQIPRPAEKIFWKDLTDAFAVKSGDALGCQPALESIFKTFHACGMAVSPRIQLSMHDYILSARDVMESVDGIDTELIALDYAVMQRLLPKINGHSRLYKELFEKLINICNTYRLDMTKKAIEEMKKNASRNMEYCQYLS